jgi:hypothetical protein
LFSKETGLDRFVRGGRDLPPVASRMRHIAEVASLCAVSLVLGR